MKFTKRTYDRTVERLQGAYSLAWLDYAETDDVLSYQAFKLLLHQANLVIARAKREGKWA